MDRVTAAERTNPDEARPAAPVLTERARTWAATMDGHAVADGSRGSGPSVRRAHVDSQAVVGAPRGATLLDREAREEAEEQAAAPGATRARGAGDRERPEEPDPWRTCFERDRDRILHAAAFRRLAGKTQVFVFPDDHQRTRLTHALEVAQVATAVARPLGLNVALTEAIALGHDCGHGPGGHASEDALGPYVVGGYDHAVWGADVVLRPLNLCRETLDGVRNHSWSRPAPSTPEGEVVSWADRIAYSCHDFEDAVAAGVVTPDVLPALVVDRCGTSRSSQLGAFVRAMVVAATESGHVGMTEPAAEALAALRSCNYDRIYLRPESRDQAERLVPLLRALVEHFAVHPREVGEGASPCPPGSEAAVHAAVTYVAGMTDRYAFQSAVRLLGWDPDRLPAGVGFAR
jgi:dGTPase